MQRGDITLWISTTRLTLGNLQRRVDEAGRGSDPLDRVIRLSSDNSIVDHYILDDYIAISSYWGTV